MDVNDLTAIALRFTIGGVMAAHGWNHLFGPGGVAGTARWFGSMGLRPPRLHALASGSLELVAAVGLVLGVVTTLQCSAVVGVMTVALITAHRTNGFFIFREGQGWEYVAVLAMVSTCLAGYGPGSLSLDHVLGLADDLDGAVGLSVAAVGGVSGAALLLTACWRPARMPTR